MNLPILSSEEIKQCLFKAKVSERLRYPKILHQKGDYFNQVFNFIVRGSYMQPHLHPGAEKTECIHIVSEKSWLSFSMTMGIFQYNLLSTCSDTLIKVPPFTWHTYITLTESAVTFETMNGVYDASSWKRYADWAPPETDESFKNYYSVIESKAIESLRNMHPIQEII